MANGLYTDAENHSRSAIDVLMSEDGIDWQDAPYNPIMAPSGTGWKRALVYQLDLRWYRGKLWLFYNAHEGWAGAREGIGCSTLDWSGPELEKMWRLTQQAERCLQQGWFPTVSPFLLAILMVGTG